MKRENVVVYATAEQKAVLRIRAAQVGKPIGNLLDDRFKSLVSNQAEKARAETHAKPMRAMRTLCGPRKRRIR